jgi:hypothetical protein
MDAPQRTRGVLDTLLLLGAMWVVVFVVLKLTGLHDFVYGMLK